MRQPVADRFATMSDPSKNSTDQRYIRQTRFSPLGIEGQLQLGRSRALVCGCGALGSVIAERLVRAGVGSVKIVDRDWVELSNLQRQSLFLERHARDAMPKAVAAAEVLREINSDIQIEAVVEDLTCDSIVNLASGCDLLLDGTDNFETRFLINDYCVQKQVPWVHGGCLGASGQVLTILPGETACFRCLVPDLPPREALQTCDTAGVLGSAIGIVANWQVAEAIKILSGNRAACCQQLLVFDSWVTDCRRIHLQPQANCPTCQQHNFEFLSGATRTESTILCGKNAVQLTLPTAAPVHLGSLAKRWLALGTVQENAFFVRLKINDFQLTVFKGGRAIVEGTTSAAEAKTVLARVLGG